MVKKSKRGGRRPGAGRKKSLPVARLTFACFRLQTIAGAQGRKIGDREVRRIIARDYMLSQMPLTFRQVYNRLQEQKNKKQEWNGVDEWHNKGVQTDIKKGVDWKTPDIILMEQEEKGSNSHNEEAQELLKQELFKEAEKIDWQKTLNTFDKKVEALRRQLFYYLSRLKKTGIPPWYHPERKGNYCFEGRIESNKIVGDVINSPFEIQEDTVILTYDGDLILLRKDREKNLALLSSGNQKVMIFRCRLDSFWTEEEKGHGEPCTCKEMPQPHRHCQICNMAGPETTMIFVHRMDGLLIERQNLGWACEKHYREVLHKAPPAPWWHSEVDRTLEQ